eukprot:3218159-Amphidinium_carterae.1
MFLNLNCKYCGSEGKTERPPHRFKNIPWMGGVYQIEHGYYRRGCINLTTTTAPLTTTTTTTLSLSQIVGFAKIQVGEFNSSHVIDAWSARDVQLASFEH